MSHRDKRGPGPRASDAQQPGGLVVGLGTSAGGMAALEQFLGHVPSGCGLIFVVVQHLDPRHSSRLADLLARHTTMPVVEAAEGVEPEPEHVYVIAPATVLTIENHAFHVAPFAEPRTALVIDTFFRSLAAAKGERAVGIVLSDSGRDGTAGLRAIKAQGGLTLAQAPETAGHDAMPECAIAAGVVDHVLPAQRMPAVLLEHAAHMATIEPAAAASLETELEGRLGAICAVVHRRTGHDFSRYKAGTLLRRTRRRMLIRHVESADQYLQVLEQMPEEPTALVKDLLIGVTQFFRDPTAFRSLAEEVLPRLLEGRPSDMPVRIWVPGCASGEEAYSIAILVREHLAPLDTRRFVQIFATDLDREKLAEARQGRYGWEIGEHVSAERLARFFVSDGQAYQATNALREMCLFSEHSLIRDPPFSQLDLISCRNVLIYLSADLQKRLIPVFHFALRPGGFLFLGPSEGVAGNQDLFEVADAASRIFRRRETARRPVVEFPLAGRGPARPTTPLPAIAGRPDGAGIAADRIGAAFERTLREEYTFPSAVVNQRGDALFVAGPIDRYLQLPAGPATVPNLFEALRGTLGRELQAAVRSARTRRRRVVRDGIVVEVEDSTRLVRLIVRPMPAVDPKQGLFLAVIQEGAPPAEAEADDVDAGRPAMERLENELRSTRAELRTTVEDLEAANEELKSSNEELISTNEELQSANEELQGSKEELQSLNEELETVNVQLHDKLDELATQATLVHLSHDAIFVRRLDGLIESWNRGAQELYGYRREEAVGRTSHELLGTIHPKPRTEIEDELRDGGCWAGELRHRTKDGRIVTVLSNMQFARGEDGVERVLEANRDITERKAGETEHRRLLAQVQAEKDKLSALVRSVSDEVWFADADKRFTLANPAALREFGLAPDDIVDVQAFAASLEVFRPDGTPRPVEEAPPLRALNGEVVINQEETVRTPATGELRHRQVSAAPVRDEAGDIIGSVCVVRDITDRKRTEAERERLAQQRQLALDAAGMGWWHYDPLTQFASYDARYKEIFGVSGHERPNEEILKLLHPDDLPRVWAAVEAALDPRDPKPYSTEYRVNRPDGTMLWVQAHGLAVFEGEGAARRATSFVGTVADITERKTTEARLAYLASFPENNPNPIVEAGADGRVRYANQTALRLFPDIREAGSAHPWLAGWEKVAGSLRDGTPVVEERTVAIGARTFQQVLSHAPEEGVVRAYGLDITERARVEAALRESERRFRTLASNAQDSITRVDRQGRYVYANPVVTRLLGLPLEAILGKTSEELGRNVGTENFEARVREVFDSGTMLRLDRRSVAGRWYDVHLVPEFRDRQVETVLVVARDITDRRKAEEALHEANLQLAEADRRKDEFLAVLSHELRNPLAPIRFSLHVLQGAVPGSEAASRAREIIDRQSAQLARLVDDLLDVTRISRNKILLRRRRLDLNDLVRRTVEDHRPLFDEKTIRINTDFAREPLPVDGDEERLAQVVGNLLQNAVKFTPEGGEVHVGTKMSASGSRALLRVADTGAGIEPAILRRLFQPFMQADETLDRSKGGLGLGLALVRGLVDMHGGEVCAHSEGPGRGAEFVIELPLDRAVGVDTAAAAPAPRQRRRVLIIEDNIDTADMLREVLELQGHVVEVAHDGRAGLAKARDFAPEAVLCDIGLPGMDGFEVARAFRADEALKRIVLVALSGYALPEDLQRSSQAGFQRHLSKPATPEQLEQLLVDLLPPT